jgi:hypothetical protein
MSLTTYKSAIYRWFALYNTPIPPVLQDAGIEPPDPKEDPPDLMRFALYHWVSWNLMVEETADWRYKVEDFNPYDICVHGQLKDIDCEPLKQHVVTTSKKTNARKHVRGVTWADLEEKYPVMTALAKELTLKYGYEI